MKSPADISVANIGFTGRLDVAGLDTYRALILHESGMESLIHQVALLFIGAIPIACIAWTVTHEEVFREPREFFLKKSEHGKNIFNRKFFYLLTCEYCFSHWVALVALFITDYQLIYNDWRGYIVAGFSLVWIANVYMTLFSRMRIDIKKEKTDIEVEEELLSKK